MRAPIRLSHSLPLMLLAGLFWMAASVTTAAENKPADAERLSRSSAGTMLNREHSGSKTRPRSQAAVINPDFWVYSATTELYFDDDLDGHYTRLLVDFDVDTSFLIADVYARLYLSRNGNPWIEYAISDDFSVLASDDSDNYVIETDFVEGYPTDYYDVLIEIYDTFDGALVAEYGPAESVDMLDLPIEDELSDRAPVRIAVSSGGGGSAGFMVLLGLCLLITRKTRSVQ